MSAGLVTHPAPHRRPTTPASSYSLPRHSPPPLVLPFSDAAADCLRDFARTIEPRVAPTVDLHLLGDRAGKLVGAIARLSGLLHLAELAPDLPLPSAALVGAQFIAPAPGIAPAAFLLPPVSPGAVDAAIILADYLIVHARAADAAMGLDPALSDVRPSLHRR